MEIGCELLEVLLLQHVKCMCTWLGYVVVILKTTLYWGV